MGRWLSRYSLRVLESIVEPCGGLRHIFLSYPLGLKAHGLIVWATWLFRWRENMFGRSRRASVTWRQVPASSRLDQGTWKASGLYLWATTRIYGLLYGRNLAFQVGVAFNQESARGCRKASSSQVCSGSLQVASSC